jgi:hypothetical protein
MDVERYERRDRNEGLVFVLLLLLLLFLTWD